MTAAEVAFVGAVAAAGGCLQGAVGFGFAVLAAPLVVLVDPTLVPGPMLAAATVLTVVLAHRERASLDIRGLRWALAGRVPGTALGALVVNALSRGALTILFALMVLVAVGVSAVGWRVRRSNPVLVVAGVASGVMGTATSIGGPPIALVYQDARGPELRSTLAGFFLFSAALSLAGLAVVGELTWGDLGRGAALALPTVAGASLSPLATDALDRGRTRDAVLAVAAASSLFVLLREIARGL